MSESDTSTAESASDERIAWRRLGRIVGFVALLVIVIPFVVYAAPQVVGAEQGYVVLSGSMEPVMSPGDVIIVDGVSAAAIQQGDVITYGGGDGETPTTHRVIEVVEQEDGVAFRTKGDANEDPDGQLVTPDRVDGRVLTLAGYLIVIPYIGYVIQFMQTSTGFMALFVVPMVLLIVSELWNVIKSSTTATGSDSADGDGRTTPESTDGQPPADVAAPDAGSEDTSAASAADTTAKDAETDDTAIVFNAMELQLGLVILGVFLAYSLWIVYAAIEIFESGVIWASGVAAAVAVTFLLFMGLYISGRGDGDAEGSGSSSAETPAAMDGGESPPDMSGSHEAKTVGEPTRSDDLDAGESEEFDWEPQGSDADGDDPAGSDERSGGGETDE